MSASSELLNKAGRLVAPAVHLQLVPVLLFGWVVLFNEPRVVLLLEEECVALSSEDKKIVYALMTATNLSAMEKLLVLLVLVVQLVVLVVGVEVSAQFEPIDKILEPYQIFQIIWVYRRLLGG